MLFTNANILCKDFNFWIGSFEIQNGKFTEILPGKLIDNGIDLHGKKVIPGLVDIHIHGTSGADFSDGSYPGLSTMVQVLAKNGITSFAPATMTLPYESIEKIILTALKLNQEKPQSCSTLRGIHIEGPYLSESERGAQNKNYLKNPDIQGFTKLYNLSEGLIRIVDIAPELPDAAEFTKIVKEFCKVSVAHTNADYLHAKTVFDAGATHLTHLFNAMTPISHRNPGVIPAAVENTAVSAEIICDGFHVHPASVRLAFSMFGYDRMILISDSGRCAGLTDGTQFEIGGQIGYVSNGVGRLNDNTIACSATNLWNCMVNAIRWGIPEEQAIRAATYNPSRAIHADKYIGTIEQGKQADFVVCSDDYSISQVYINGIQV